MGLYEKIKEIADLKGYSIKKIEEELGLPRSSISKYDKNQPSFDKIWKIANFLGVSLDCFGDYELYSPSKANTQIIVSEHFLKEKSLPDEGQALHIELILMAKYSLLIHEGNCDKSFYQFAIESLKENPYLDQISDKAKNILYIKYGLHNDDNENKTIEEMLATIDPKKSERIKKLIYSLVNSDPKIQEQVADYIEFLRHKK